MSATFYVQFEPTYAYWPRDKVNGAKAVKLTQNKPATLTKGAVAVKFSVDVPIALFEPAEIVTTVEIPEPVEPEVITSADIVELGERLIEHGIEES